MTTSASAAQSDAISTKYREQWDDPALQERIEQGIRKNRMSDLRLRIEDAVGAPLPGAAVTIEQLGHEFLFGANIFMFGNYDEEGNRRYESVFQNLLNAATVPLYWKDLETAPGVYRFAADSPKIYRRPPSDPVVEFCEKNGLVMDGHTLVWDNAQHSLPDWLPEDGEARWEPIRRRIHTLGERYGGRIQRWDVVNEFLGKRQAMPDDYVLRSHLEAQKALPADAVRMHNEDTSIWTRNRERHRELIRDLQARGARIDMLGLQFHMFALDNVREALAGNLLTPEIVLETLDGLTEFNLPLHVSEITFPMLSDSPAHRAIQAEMTRNYYRLWFSHPLVRWITWWNLVDRSGVPGNGHAWSEAHLEAGLLDADLNPKPAYEALDQLINHDWKTKARLDSDGAGECATRAFHGTYRVTVDYAGARSVHEISLGSKDDAAARTLRHAPLAAAPGGQQ